MFKNLKLFFFKEKSCDIVFTGIHRKSCTKWVVWKQGYNWYKLTFFNTKF